MNRISTHRNIFTDAGNRRIQVTYFTIAGTAPGPVLTIIAGQHGMEHSGPNLLPELIEELGETEFSGTVHICPCANPAALEIDYEFYPENEDLGKIRDYYYSIFRHNYCPWGLGRDNGETLYNMNRLWKHPDTPGVAGRITQWLWNEICAGADVIIDMHCLQAEKPLIFNHREKNNAIARYAGIEAIFMCNPNPDAYNAGNLTNRGSEAGNQYSFCIEFSRQHALKESEYELGKQSVRNVMTGIGMMEGEVILARPVRVIAHDARSMRSDVTHTGHIRFHVNLFDRVEQGAKLYEVRDIQTVELLEEGFAAFDGVVTEISHYPVARPGIPVCRIAEGRLLAEAGEPLPKLPDHFFNH